MACNKEVVNKKNNRYCSTDLFNNVLWLPHIFFFVATLQGQKYRCVIGETRPYLSQFQSLEIRRSANFMSTMEFGAAKGPSGQPILGANILLTYRNKKSTGRYEQEDIGCFINKVFL